MSEWNYVIAAYALTWVAVLGYAVRLAYRLRRAAEDLEMSAAASATEKGNERA